MKWIIQSAKAVNILDTLLTNRGVKNKEEFLQPENPSTISIKGLKKAVDRIKSAIKNNEKIVVYGDYDADGICSTGIIWEALQQNGAKILPFIPKREKEGYGLSKEGIDQLDASLIISVDSGISANDAVDYASSKGIDVIILDHHEKPEELPKAFAIIHETSLCAAGISYVFAKEFNYDGLELATIATITDLMPLVGANRSIVKFGLEALSKTERPGLKALFEILKIEKVGTFEIGYQIGPRLNATGRIDSALLGLRLLCTKNPVKAIEYAKELDQINRLRQDLLEKQVNHAMLKALSDSDKLIFVEDESYHQGVIGLIAGKLTEKHYLPSIVISRSESTSKASARSITGFNIIEAIRSHMELLVSAGGHPMAAGFTIETNKIELFKSKISETASERISKDMLEKVLKIDLELDFSVLSLELFNEISKLAPYGIGNPEPVFASEGKVQDMRTVGADGKHLKLKIGGFDAIAFGQGSKISEFKIGNNIRIAYNLDLNSWNGHQNLQLKIKDIVLK